jgi:membrane-bound lytic murein transglycosylase A
MIKYIFLIVITIFFIGCENRTIETKPEISNAKLEKLSFDDIEGFQKDDLDLALEVFKKDCYASKKKELLKEVCKNAKVSSSGYHFFTQHFTPYRLLDENKRSRGLITGYYEPILNGSLVQTNKYKYPVYKTPSDLITVRLDKIYPELKKYRLRGKVINNILQPYETREELKKSNKNLEAILYVDNKIDRFFMEIQGSGKVKLPNGKIVNIAYDNQNGRAYYAVGRRLIETGEVKKEDMSLQAIYKWCEENPEKVEELFNLNDSVVFFRKSSKSATGSLGVPLVAKRNIAVDRNYIPLGFPVFVDTTNPITKDKIQTLTIAADTGGAIKGDVRADFFWGNGKEAKEVAGKMAQSGSLIIFVPNIKTQRWSQDNSKYIKVNL